MIIIFAKKLVNDVKQELLSEIEKFRTDNHIKNVIILQSIPETQESITRPILPEPEISIAQQLSDDTQQGLLSELEKLRKEEEMILECIPEMLEAPTKLIPSKSGIPVSEKNARRYHTQNTVKHFNRIQQRYNKHSYQKIRNKTR
ncbi:MAG: hypothetical protein UIC65_01950 [Alphaproteobacteria bacterium]|nr:hypothetical protein [Alphaproteobacteria bacterium]